MPPRLRPRRPPAARRLPAGCPPVARRLPDARPRAPSSAVERGARACAGGIERGRPNGALPRAGREKRAGPQRKRAARGRPFACDARVSARQNFSISLRIAAKRLPYGGAIIARVFRRGCVSTGFIFENVTKPS
ncbi:hypothetical protein DM45_2171 [Burkholderia mallei]|nr:hypothetical protein DM45_2171 [Burkholderia mallei]